MANRTDDFRVAADRLWRICSAECGAAEDAYLVACAEASRASREARDQALARWATAYAALLDAHFPMPGRSSSAADHDRVGGLDARAAIAKARGES